MSPAAAEALLRGKGHSITAPRRAILRFFHGNTSHPTAGDVYAAVSADHPDASRATVYATLALLTEVGAVRALRTAEAETRYDPNVEAHHHTVCPTCGALADIPAEAVAVTLHGRVIQAEVRIEEPCEACQEIVERSLRQFG